MPGLAPTPPTHAAEAAIRLPDGSTLPPLSPSIFDVMDSGETVVPTAASPRTTTPPPATVAPTDVEVTPAQDGAPAEAEERRATATTGRRSGTTPTPRGWGRRFLQAVQAFGAVERISRGRGYARGGHVLSHAVQTGRIVAQVQGSRWPPYDVRFEVQAFDELEWRHVLECVARRPLHAARLLAGEMPSDIESVFAEVGLSLIPQREIRATCTCPADDACKHIAAVSYVVADALDEDPFLLCTLRGRSRAQLLAALGDSGSGAVGRVPLPARPAAFWRTTAPEVFVHDIDADGPSDAAVLRFLGAPADWTDAVTFEQLLAPAYDAVARQAARLCGES